MHTVLYNSIVCVFVYFQIESSPNRTASETFGRSPRKVDRCVTDLLETEVSNNEFLK